MSRSVSRSTPWRLAISLSAGALILVVWDLIRPPEEQASVDVLLGAIDLYQRTGSPALGAAGVRCRFEPSCSHYAEAVIRKHGAVVGSWRSLARIGRCGPWTPAGTHDPP